MNNSIQHLHNELDRIFDNTFRSIGIPSFRFGESFLSKIPEEILKPTLDLGATEMDTLSALNFRDSTPMDYTSCGVFPLINITENHNNYYVRAELPGLKAEDIDIQVAGKNLSISGERKIPSEGENVKYHRRKREAGKFSRIISLPGEIDDDQIEAQTVNGILMLNIPKSEKAKPKRIAVK